MAVVIARDHRHGVAARSGWKREPRRDRCLPLSKLEHHDRPTNLGCRVFVAQSSLVIVASAFLFVAVAAAFLLLDS